MWCRGICRFLLYGRICTRLLILFLCSGGIYLFLVLFILYDRISTRLIILILWCGITYLCLVLFLFCGRISAIISISLLLCHSWSDWFSFWPLILSCFIWLICSVRNWHLWLTILPIISFLFLLWLSFSIIWRVMLRSFRTLTFLLRLTLSLTTLFFILDFAINLSGSVLKSLVFVWWLNYNLFSLYFASDHLLCLAIRRFLLSLFLLLVSCQFCIFLCTINFAILSYIDLFRLFWVCRIILGVVLDFLPTINHIWLFNNLLLSVCNNWRFFYRD